LAFEKGPILPQNPATLDGSIVGGPQHRGRAILSPRWAKRVAFAPPNRSARAQTVK
jgi:hypothetical protein